MAHESTDAFLALAAEKIAATHPTARELAGQAATVLAALKSAAADQRAALVQIQINETDAGILGKLIEAEDTLKTIDRLAGELQVTVMKFLPVLTRHESMVQQLTDLRAAIVE